MYIVVMLDSNDEKDFDLFASKEHAIHGAKVKIKEGFKLVYIAKIIYDVRRSLCISDYDTGIEHLEKITV